MCAAHLMFRDVDGFVQDDPHGGFPASRVCGRTLVRHEMIGVGQQAA